MLSEQMARAIQFRNSFNIYNQIHAIQIPATMIIITLDCCCSYYLNYLYVLNLSYKKTHCLLKPLSQRDRGHS